MANKQIWITTQEAARVSGYHPEYVRELVRNRAIKGRKFGIVWQVNKQSLLNYLQVSKDSVDKRHGPKRT